MVDVRAELHHVWAARPQETVGELIPLFGPAYEAERFPPDKREPRNVDSHVTAGRIGRVGVEQTAPRILETEFVDFVRADRPQVLRGDAGIAEDLLRGARERVLAEVPRSSLRVYLDPGDRARAGAAPQHQLMRAVEVVIKAEGIDARPLKNREIAPHRIQRHKRSR